MQEKKLYSSIGLMSGTSMDGIDIAFIQSDGESIIQNKKFSYYPFEKYLRKKISHIIKNNPPTDEIKEVEKEFTLHNAKLVELFVEEHSLDRKEIDLICFAGHTIAHDPSKSLTKQLGNPELLEEKTKIQTVGHIRAYDVARGGQGAPLVPIYHFYMTKNLPKPLAVLNIGGVNNITYIPNKDENDMVAFDISFGNAPFDDLVAKNTDMIYDEDGKIGLSGKVHEKICSKILKNKIFYQKPPKSFDRDDFHEAIKPIEDLDLPDALASLAYIHAKVLKKNIELFCPENPQTIYICGGGLKNKALVKYMQEELIGIEIKSTSDIGFDPDQIEAQAFAFLGIRRILNLPISFRKTTGILQETDSFQASSQR